MYEEESEIEEIEKNENFTKRHLLAKKVLKSGKVILSDSEDEETHYDFIEESHNKMRT